MRDKQKFKVGDRVQIVGDGYKDEITGIAGTILAIKEISQHEKESCPELRGIDGYIRILIESLNCEVGVYCYDDLGYAPPNGLQKLSKLLK